MQDKKGFSILEFIVLTSIITVAAIIIFPIFFKSTEQRQEAAVRANAKIASSAIITEFSHNKNSTPEEIAIFITESLNQTTKNPIDQEGKAFMVNLTAKGTVKLIPDNEEGIIIVESYGKDPETPLSEQVLHYPQED